MRLREGFPLVGSQAGNRQRWFCVTRAVRLLDSEPLQSGQIGTARFWMYSMNGNPGFVRIVGIITERAKTQTRCLLPDSRDARRVRLWRQLRVSSARRISRVLRRARIRIRCVDGLLHASRAGRTRRPGRVVNRRRS